ncbi:hypothetical protein F4604DRAFT_1674176 [Suillus subluteus]|nr:hypothetical protein F4604DRAFT_1674176 [Suillus subluteus]
MLHKLSEYYSDPLDDQVSSPPTYLPALLPAPTGSGYVQEGYVQEQFGGGRYKDTPAELTPSRLRSTIKPTSRDVGIARDAAIRRQAACAPSDRTTNSFISNSMHSILNSHHNSPLVEDVPAQHPVRVEDLFADTLAPTGQQQHQ